MRLSTVLALSVGAPRVEGVIDRFEGELAVIEWAGGPLVDVPRLWVPSDCREGDRVSLLTWLGPTPPPIFPGALAPLPTHTIPGRLTPCRDHHTKERP